MKVQFPDHVIDKAARLKFLKDNKDIIIAAKKAELKFVDTITGMGLNVAFISKDGSTVKALGKNVDIASLKEIDVVVVINSTNIIDSHDDAHMPTLWNKSIKENKLIKFLQEHELKFDKVIADKADLKVYVANKTWKELGFPKYKGISEALIFEAKVKKSRNPFMFQQYAEGNVDNHSVGMFYLELFLCIEEEDEYYEEENKNWAKYIKQVVNPEVAKANGYFFAITQAKCVEGSAVVLGSNAATPTLSVEAGKSTATDGNTTAAKHGIDYKSLAEKLNLLN